jgi:hypothetical protein
MLMSSGENQRKLLSDDMKISASISMIVPTYNEMKMIERSVKNLDDPALHSKERSHVGAPFRVRVALDQLVVHFLILRGYLLGIEFL